MQKLRIRLVLFVLASLLLSGCQQKVLAPSEIEAAQAANDAYVAYARGDCDTARRLADPDRLERWAFNEMRHSMLLIQGFCRELEGNTEGARDIYRVLVLESPRSFAADDAAERTRVPKLMSEERDYIERLGEAKSRVDSDKPRRTPIDRIPVEFPPLAKATGIEGYAIVEFGITQRGNTENPVIVESNPPYLFDGTSLRAIRRWQYARESSGKDDRQLIRILFKADGSQDSSRESPVENAEVQ